MHIGLEVNRCSFGSAHEAYCDAITSKRQGHRSRLSNAGAQPPAREASWSAGATCWTTLLGGLPSDEQLLSAQRLRGPAAHDGQFRKDRKMLDL
jgi:hypothetical protein